MKKNGIVVAAVALAAVLGVGLWFFGYYSRKSNDNIPSKELMVTYCTEKGEEYASAQLAGYSQSQLREVWGEPDGTLFGFWGEIWKVDEDTQIIVYFHTKTGRDWGIVEAVKLNVDSVKE